MIFLFEGFCIILLVLFFCFKRVLGVVLGVLVLLEFFWYCIGCLFDEVLGFILIFIVDDFLALLVLDLGD